MKVISVSIIFYECNDCNQFRHHDIRNCSDPMNVYNDAGASDANVLSSM